MTKHLPLIAIFLALGAACGLRAGAADPSVSPFQDEGPELKIKEADAPAPLEFGPLPEKGSLAIGGQTSAGIPASSGFPSGGSPAASPVLRHPASGPDALPDEVCCEPPGRRRGVIGYADYLHWKARMSGLDFAQSVNPVGLVPLGNQSLDFDRQAGIRAGLGYAFSDCWDMTCHYTYFATDDQQSATNISELPGILPVAALLSTRSFLNTQFMDTVTAQSSFRLNMFDAEANWRPCLTETVGFRGFGGIRWAEMDQTFDSSYQYRVAPADPLSPVVNGRIQTPWSMDAAGLRIGAELQWRPSPRWRLFGQGAQSLLVADFDGRRREENTLSGLIVDVPQHTSRIVPVLEASVGLAWTRGPLELSAGYEVSNWFNMADFKVVNFNDLGLEIGSRSVFLDGFFLRLALVR